MPVDTSIYGLLKPVDPMATINELANTGSAISQNRLLQFDLAGKNALAAAVQGAIDPGTGQFDTNALVRSLQQPGNAPAAAIGTGLALDYAGKQLGNVGAGLTNEGLGLTNQQTGQNLEQSAFGNAGSAFGALLSQKDPATGQSVPVTYDALHNLVVDLGAQGRITPQIQKEMLRSIPGDPDAARAWAEHTYLASLPAEVTAATGAPAAPGPGGAPRSQLGGQAISESLGGGITTALPPGVAEAMQRSAASYQALLDDVGGPNGAATRIFQLGKALSGLQGSNTGPGTEWQNDLQSFIVANAPSLGVQLGIDPAKVANYDEANKYLTAYASAQAGAIGPNTNQSLSTFLSANASTHISELASQDVTKAALALERMKLAEAYVFNQSGGLPGEFSSFSVDWNRNADPRAYAIDLMSPEAIKTFYGKLKGDEKSRFLDNLRIAIASGLVDPSKLPGAQPAPAAGAQ